VSYVFLPPFRLSFPSLSSRRFNGSLRRGILHDDHDDDGNDDKTTAEGLYGYLNTFTINSQERPLESRSRHAAPSLSRARLIRPSFHPALFTA